MPVRVPRKPTDKRIVPLSIKELELPAGKDARGEYPGGHIFYVEDSSADRAQQRFLDVWSVVESLADYRLRSPPEAYFKSIREWLRHADFKTDFLSDDKFTIKFIRKLGFSLTRAGTGLFDGLTDLQIERFAGFVERFYSEFLEGVEGKIRYSSAKEKRNEEEILKRKKRFQAVLGRKQYVFAMALNKALYPNLHDPFSRSLQVFRLTGVNPLRDNQPPRTKK